jgi:VanZ family protein
MTLKTFVRILSWLCVVAIVVLSLLPGSDRPHTGATGPLEHVFAYGGTGFLFALSYHSLRIRLLSLVTLSILSGLFEIAQHWIPGRNSQVIDVLASITGLSVGLLLGAGTLVLLRRSRGDAP